MIKKAPKPFVNLILGGVFFLLPLLLLSFFIRRIFQVLNPISLAIASFLDTPNVFNIVLVYLLSLLLLLLLCYFAGVLLNKGVIRNWNPAMDEKLFYLMPGLQRFKFSLTGKEAHLWGGPWHAGLIKDNDCFRPGYVAHSADPDYYCVFFPDAPRMESGEIRYFHKDTMEYRQLSMKEMTDSFKKFGRTLPVSEVLKRDINPTDPDT